MLCKCPCPADPSSESMLLMTARQRGLSRTLPGAEAELGLPWPFSPYLPKATLLNDHEATVQRPPVHPFCPKASVSGRKSPHEGEQGQGMQSSLILPSPPISRSVGDAQMWTNVRLEVHGELSPGAVPFSPLEQISVPSALCWLWRSQPRAFVSSGKTMLHTTPTGLRVLWGSRQECASLTLLRRAPAAVIQSVPFSPLPCMPLRSWHFPRSLLTPKADP